MSQQKKSVIVYAQTFESAFEAFDKIRDSMKEAEVVKILAREYHRRNVRLCLGDARTQETAKEQGKVHRF